MKKTPLRLLLSLALLTSAVLVVFKFPGYKKVNIVFIGDSITQGGNRAAFQPSVYAVTYLKDKLPAVTINQANAGVSGRTTLDFLPGQKDFNKAAKAADILYTDKNAQLLFSIMLGTNDSAMKGPHGAPVAPQDYKHNLSIIIDTLLQRYPNSKIVLNHPLWYSPNTYNGAMYLAEGLARLQTYFPEIDGLVKSYTLTNPGHVFIGDKAGFTYFKKNYADAFKQEQGRQGIFYLHPNEQGASGLGVLWGKAIYKVLK
ncbi:MAG: lipolytic protein family [Mucilaginibacter sp.]|nr:lipolytic protein family [Mucilaginibacter sp.]